MGVRSGLEAAPKKKKSRRKGGCGTGWVRLWVKMLYVRFSHYLAPWHRQGWECARALETYVRSFGLHSGQLANPVLRFSLRSRKLYR
jgi:hypothetical protein